MTETGSEFTISRAYEDHRDLLTRIKAEIPDGGGGTNVVSQYDYAYDSIGLRSSVVNSGTAFSTNAEHTIWGYNDRAELASSYRYVGSNPSTTTNEVAAERRSYVYDPIGNRQYAYVGSSPSPNPAYAANNLNQYTSTTNPNEELFDYDEDGNMTEDGTFEYTWNGENRLMQVEPKTPASGDLRLTFAYDYMGRRVQKVEEEYDGSSWSTNAVAKFVWDLSAVPTGQAGGWLLIAELDGTDSDTLTRTYTWGLDLSGTFTGAGGIRLRSGSYGGHVGGLLMVDDEDGDGFCGYYAYDGNGNVRQVLDADDLSTDAHYEYDPYGREIVATGTYADDNPWRFSTKYIDVLDPNDTDASLLYCGFRHLSRRLGRWMSRDPIGRGGGLGLYVLLGNGPVTGLDLYGLAPWTGCCDSKKYNRFSECCCDHGRIVRTGGPGCKIVRKEKVATGIRRCCQWGRTVLQVGLTKIDKPWHCWVEWPSPPGHGSAGYHPGQVKSPDSDYAGNPVSAPNPKCDEEKLSPCEYDIHFFKRCLATAADTGWRPWQLMEFDCRHWSKYVIKICKEMSRNRCTMP